MPEEIGRQPSRFTRFKRKHPYAYRTLRNVAITGAIAGPAAYMANRNLRTAAAITTGKATGLAATRNSFARKARFWTGGVPGPIAGGMKFVKAAKGTGKRAARLMKSGKRYRAAAYAVGGIGGLGAVGFPASDFYVERRQLREMKRSVGTPVMVVNRRTKEVRTIYA